MANQAVGAQLTERGHPVVAADDAPDDRALSHAGELGINLRERPDPEAWLALVANARVMVPTPGLPERHPAFGAAAATGTPIVSELDLAQRWDSRPTLAVTGTSGKTTVTLLISSMLEASGIAASVAGNTETPMVEAIRDPRPAVFVVEASSFRLGHSRCYRPAVGAWLNFAPDHLDVHESLASYRAAKASLWARAAGGTTAVVNRDDPVVAAHAPRRGRVVEYGLGEGDHRVSGTRPAAWPGGEYGAGEGDYRVSGEALWAGSTELVPIAELRRSQPHELSNALAAAAVAMAGGAHPDGVRLALRQWVGLPHRMMLVAEHNGVRYYDDSKSTTPHSVRAAVRSVESAVLIAGGRNKGLDLGAMAEIAGRLRAVVAIGEAAPEVQEAFARRCPVVVATSMEEAVSSAAGLARTGDDVLLSPGCASFDWYESYAQRGDHFAHLVEELIGGSR